MPGPAAPFLVAAGCATAGAAAAMYLTRHPQDAQHPGGAVTSVGAGILPVQSSASPGLQTRPVSYKRNSDSSYGEEQSPSTSSSDEHELDTMNTRGREEGWSFRLNPEDMIFGCI
ncbi:uncharacterized protein SPPG_03980 [Spizellomyces punctatus DAOM BR117]|uniref:Uncharacterized protein n=1 Tax=Spizellomyces punctatus (strain DAOM BR117) TaxID=645134 RepID=A0A0L0HJ68_SPIPD|nr:uncharacterized protein SPPG_03980 [Spizellomyces punctatus DAOM BR117]KND00879.1 hypothetical protein SPPG_03980 [Spizellomyces punctatus DAOM BR117]|eukprot:XP_016608918.1 hypothetical protein SPPG_03980 [Spizellomyces punctatus DAOM BR117]